MPSRLPQVIAHRGASFYAPENTLAAFNKAFELGAKIVEFDVRLTADNIPVIIHDETVDRTTNGKGLVSKLTLQEIKKLDAGQGEHIPTLEEVMLFLHEKGMSANVEIKPSKGHEENTVAQVLKVINKLDLGDMTILYSSFSMPTLRHLRQQSSDCHIGILLDKWNPGWLALSQELKSVAINLNYQHLNKERAAEIKKQGQFLLCFTVDDKSIAEQLFSWKVDSIFTNIPDLMTKSLEVAPPDTGYHSPSLRGSR